MTGQIYAKPEQIINRALEQHEKLRFFYKLRLQSDIYSYSWLSEFPSAEAGGAGRDGGFLIK